MYEKMKRVFCKRVVEVCNTKVCLAPKHPRKKKRKKNIYIKNISVFIFVYKVILF